MPEACRPGECTHVWHSSQSVRLCMPTLKHQTVQGALLHCFLGSGTAGTDTRRQRAVQRSVWCFSSTAAAAGSAARPRGASLVTPLSRNGWYLTGRRQLDRRLPLLSRPLCVGAAGAPEGSHPPAARTRAQKRDRCCPGGVAAACPPTLSTALR